MNIEVRSSRSKILIFKIVLVGAMKKLSVISSKLSMQVVENRSLSTVGGVVVAGFGRGLVRSGAIAGCLLGVVIALTGCEPRGETKTVAEVYEISREELVQALSKSISVEAREKISIIQRSMQLMADAQNDGEIRRAAGEAATALQTLINWAGYTSRAAGGELLQQLSNMEGTSAQGDRVNVNPAAAKLLAARTLSWVASEMNSLAFGLKEREGR